MKYKIRFNNEVLEGNTVSGILAEAVASLGVERVIEKNVRKGKFPLVHNGYVPMRTWLTAVGGKRYKSMTQYPDDRYFIHNSLNRFEVTALLATLAKEFKVKFSAFQI